MYELNTIQELVQELKKLSSSYCLLYIIRNEDTGPHHIKTNIQNYESHRLQCLGIAYKLHNWLDSKCNKKIEESTAPTQFKEFDDSSIKNTEGKSIITELNKRCVAIIGGIIFLDGEVHIFQKDNAKGQSLGLSKELLVEVIEKLT